MHDVANENDELRRAKEAQRAADWVLPAAIILLAPPTVVLLWMATVHFEGSLLAMSRDPARVAELWPWPSFYALAIIGGWVGLQTLLLLALPGGEMRGPPTPMGERPRYKTNGVLAFVVTHLLLLGASALGVISLSVVYERFGELLATASVLGIVLAAALFVKGTHAPSGADAGRRGHLVADFFRGVELHPRLGGVELKQLVNCRVAMMGWSAIVLSFVAAHRALHGTVSPAMAASAGVSMLYVLKFFVEERDYFASLDITHDRFGFYLVWGILAWLPGMYTLAPLFLVREPGGLSVAGAVIVFGLGLVAVALNRQADRQRHHVRSTGGDTHVWGRPPVLIRALYTTGDGVARESLLLASGWWGVARHFSYAPELAVAVLLTLPTGFSYLVPWIYPLYLAVLLVHRTMRDDARCREKYGTAWSEYCERVPWRIFPGIY